MLASLNEVETLKPPSTCHKAAPKGPGEKGEEINFEPWNSHLYGFCRFWGSGRRNPGGKGNPIDQLTGKVWQESKESNKQAILFGIDLGVAANYFAEQKARENFAKKSKKQPPRFLSHFDRCWMEAFRDVSRKDAVKMVDDWYAAHPDQLDRPVLGVLWNEVVTPLLNKKQ